MKKIKAIKALMVTILLIMLFAFSASAVNHVESINIDVTLNKDGSADIHQEWTGEFDEGTECYYEFNTGNRLELKNLKVSKDGKEYQTIYSWNVNASFLLKFYKCGINTVDRDTVEVCWGISEYGNNTYEIDYTVYNVVGSHPESDGFNFRFINDKMNTGPTDARVTVSLWDGTPITDENCNIWAFGYSGMFEFKDGKAVAYTENALRSQNHVTLMMEFPKGIFEPAYISDESFEEVKEEAFSGSDYNSGDQYAYGIIDKIVIVIFVCILILGVLGFVGYFLARKLKKEKLKKESIYYRDVPAKDELNKYYILMHSLKETEESSIIAARILSLIIAGVIEPIDTGEKNIKKKGVSFKINSAINVDLNEYDRRLYAILKASAGDDGVLEPAEMTKYCNKHHEILRSFLSKCKGDGTKALNTLRASKNGSYTNVFKLTESGINEFQKIYGLKKYLSDFSLIDERTVGDISIWQEYLVYASLFGIADKVAEQLKKVYPAQIPEIEYYERNVIFANTCRTHIYVNMRKTEQAVQSQSVRYSGGGGGASFGGGGGFSGGGSGGGTR